MLRLVDELAERVEKLICDRRLLPDGLGALVGVSGGADSMVLLHVMHSLAVRHRWKLVVAHFNHQLRGRDADADENLVKGTAKKLGLPFKAARQDVKQFAGAQGISLEMGARQLRHQFFSKTAGHLRLRHVLLAHHADDQVELFFVRLLRGAGNQGLGGMEISTPSPVDRSMALLRPLLGASKSELLAYAREHRVPFREDVTNDSTDVLRNRIRHKLLPLLRKDYQSKIDRAVLRSMDLSRTEGDFVTIEAAKWLRARKKKSKFKDLHLALQRRIIQLELLSNGVTPGFEQVEKLRVTPDCWLSIEPELAIRLNEQGRIERRPVEKTLPEQQETAAVSVKDGSCAFNGRTFQFSYKKGQKRPGRAQRTEFFDADSVGDPIVLRHWRPGDRFQPIGLAHDVKLQDWFVNQKIPREKRHQLVVATNAAGSIFWVEGLRIGEKFKITKETKAILQWRWR